MGNEKDSSYKVDILGLHIKVDLVATDKGLQLTERDLEDFFVKPYSQNGIKLEEESEEEELREACSSSSNLEYRYGGSITKLPDTVPSPFLTDHEEKDVSEDENESARGGLLRKLKGKPRKALIIIMVMLVSPGPVFGNSGIDCVGKPLVSVENSKYQILDRNLNCSSKHDIALQCEKDQKMVCLRVYSSEDLAYGCAPNLCINGNGCPEWSQFENGLKVLHIRHKECGSICPYHYDLFDVEKYKVCQERKKTSSHWQDSTTRLPMTEKSSEPSLHVSTTGENASHIPTEKAAELSNTGIAIGIGTTVPVLIIIVVIGVCIYWRKRVCIYWRKRVCIYWRKNYPAAEKAKHELL